MLWAACHLGTCCGDLWHLELGHLWGRLRASAKDSLSTRAYGVQCGDSPFLSQGHQVSLGLPNSCKTPFLPGIYLSFKNHGENWTELNGEAQRRGADLPSVVFPALGGVCGSGLKVTVQQAGELSQEEKMIRVVPGEPLRSSGLGVTFGRDEQQFFFRRNSMSFQGAHAMGPCESELRSLHVRGTTSVELQEAGRAWGRASVLHTLQGVVWVTALPFYQGLTQAAGICISLTAPVFTDVIFVQQCQ